MLKCIVRVTCAREYPAPQYHNQNWVRDHMPVCATAGKVSDHTACSETSVHEGLLQSDIEYDGASGPSIAKCLVI